MIYGFIFVAIIMLLANLPGYARRQLTKKLAIESCEARDSVQLSQWYPLSKIEWLRFYPFKKLLIGGLWLFCSFYSVAGIFMTLKEQRTDFLWITIVLWAITLLTVRRVWRYIMLPYHCVPILNRSQTKEQLKESLRGECFELVTFQNRLLQKYVPVLLSENWAVIDGTLISRKAIKQVYFLHDIPPVQKYVQIKFKYFNGEEFSLPTTSLYTDGQPAMEMSALLHKITSEEIVEEEEISSTSRKKEKSMVYWNMNYKGKFKRTVWFIPLVIVLCFLTPLFMGSFWFVYDIILVLILVWQLRYTYKMMKLEEKKSKEIKEVTENEMNIS